MNNLFLSLNLLTSLVAVSIKEQKQLKKAKTNVPLKGTFQSSLGKAATLFKRPVIKIPK